MTFVTDIENVSADLSSAALIDISTYGGSNPARNTLALYTYLYKRAADNTDTQITVDNTSPLSVNSWSFTLPAQDGLFVAIVFGFVIWTAGTYTLNNCLYYNGNYYVCIAASTTALPTDATKWSLITDILGTVLNLSNSNVNITQTYNWSDAHATTGPMADALADFGPNVKNGKCKNWQLAANVLEGGALIESAWTNFRRADYTTAQEIIDYVDAQTASTL